MMELVNSYNALATASLKRVVSDIFTKKDVNVDGRLSKSEFESFSNSAKGVLALSGISIADTEEYFSEADTNSDEYLTFAEIDKGSTGEQATNPIPNSTALVMSMAITDLSTKTASGSPDVKNFFDNYISTEQEVMNFTYGASSTYTMIQDATQASGSVFNSIF